MSGSPIPMDVCQPLLIDWGRILEDLKEHGCSYRKVARLMGVEWSTVQRWRALKPGGDIGHSFGRALLSIHEHFCGQARTLQRLTEARQRA